MSYLVLARKYRPQVFDDVVGQTQVTRTLANAIAGGRVAHAYLFCGPRGVGKTTAARILAKALNCEQGPAPVPCNTCSRCVEITAGRSLDVLEIDGASNRGIDEVRELRENARYAPAGGGYKVYIIDEVHMLTKEAFNALLKTLEEPPSHVVFVLATTDPFKMPPTILSRCQRFDFARIHTRDIAAHLESILAKEGIDAAPEALALVARRAQGGLRDALSLTDQIISAAEGTIDRDAVETILGLVGEDFFFSVVDRFREQDSGGALRLLHEIHRHGADLEEVAKGLVSHLRDLYLVRLGPDLADLLETPLSEVPRYREQAEAWAPETLSEMLETAADAAVRIRRTENPRLTLELAFTDLAGAAGRVPLGELYGRLLELERRLGGEGPPPKPASRRTAPATPPPAPEKRPRARREDAPSAPDAATTPSAGKPAVSTRNTPAAKPEAKAAPGSPEAAWLQCLDLIKDRGRMSVWGALSTVQAVGFRDDGALVLRPLEGNPLQQQALTDRGNRDLLMEVLTETGRGSGFCLESDAAAPPQPAAKTKSPKDTRSMGEVFKDEPMIQKVIDMFDGEVLP